MCELFDFWLLRSPSDALNFDNNPATSVKIVFLDSASSVIVECGQDCRVRSDNNNSWSKILTILFQSLTIQIENINDEFPEYIDLDSNMVELGN